MAKNGNGLHLPGTFTSFPKGPKPKHYAPHAQPTVSSHGVTPGRAGGQPTISAFTPFVGQHHNISPFQAPATTPHGHIRTPAEAKASLPARAPRHNISKFVAPARNPAMHGEFKQPSAPPADTDPMGNYYFTLEISTHDAGASADSKAYNEVAHFRECSGLKTTSEVFEIIEGGMNSRTHRRPGQSKWENIVIKYASSSSIFLLAWRDLFLQDKFSNRLKYSGSIAIRNNNGKVVRRFHFTNAWPVSWEGPSLNAGGSDLAVETLEIAHEGLTLSAEMTDFTQNSIV